MSSYVALEIDPTTKIPIDGPILAWSPLITEALKEGLSCVDKNHIVHIKAFRWYGREHPSEWANWAYHRGTKTIVETK